MYAISNMVLISDELIPLQTQLQSASGICNAGEEVLAVVFCQQGRFYIPKRGLNDQILPKERWRATPNDVVLCRRSELLLARHSKTCRFLSIIVPISLAQNILTKVYPWQKDWPAKIQYVKHCPLVSLPFNERNFYIFYLHFMQERMNQLSRPHYSFTLRNMLDSLILDLAASICLADDSLAQSADSVKHDILYRNFLDMLYKHRVVHREVGWYAQQLSVTNRKLTLACLSQNKLSASQIIHKVCIEQLKIAIRKMPDQHQLTTIVKKFGFPSMPFFCKYFKQHVGVTPQQYRAHLLANK